MGSINGTWNINHIYINTKGQSFFFVPYYKTIIIDPVGTFKPPYKKVEYYRFSQTGKYETLFLNLPVETGILYPSNETIEKIEKLMDVPMRNFNEREDLSSQILNEMGDIDIQQFEIYGLNQLVKKKDEEGSDENNLLPFECQDL